MSRLPFEKLEIWQKGVVLAQLIYTHTRKFPKEELFGLTSQLRKCVVSVPSNTAEGSQRTSDKDFANFCLIAKGSFAEMKTQVLLAQHFGYLDPKTSRELLDAIEELDKMLRAFHKKLTAFCLLSLS